MKFIYTIVFGILFTLQPCVSKADIYLLNLDQSIAIAKMKSLDMLSLKQDLKIAEYNLHSATSRFKTHIDLDLTIPNYTETIRQFE
ncbi:MAG: hypothetical protein JW798_15705, partial [Prolixibacteraceae bacterium]|nr:hypothetical protein [Prolixibacteraceae bacterium]